MDHKFVAGIDASKCASCKFDEISHSDRATCETCDNSGEMDTFAGMLMCPTCLANEKRAVGDYQSPEKQEARFNEYRATELLTRSKEIDASIQTRMDIFNAATISIASLKEAIDADGSIENKHFALAETLQERFNHFKQVIFEAKETQIKATNEQRAIQVYFNELTKKLKSEEREKFKIQDINYQPVAPKLKKTTIPRKAKYDKVELRKYAAELGLPEMALQMLVVSKGITVEEAANRLRKTIKEVDSETTGN